MITIRVWQLVLASLCLLYSVTAWKEHGSKPSSTPEFDYLFTINYKFGGASPIIFSQGVTENINTYIGASIDGPAFHAEIDRGVITNKFVAFGYDTIVFEEATFFGTFDNGAKGNGTFIGRGLGLVDFEQQEQQRLTLTLDDGDFAYLQYIYILCGSITFDLRSASAAQDCYRTKIGNKVVLPPIFT